MYVRTGIANLPLHNGKAPRWLFRRMVKLSGLIAEYIIDEYGCEEFLRRISNPFFFQALGCVVGFDWHSSGLTTTTCAALKEYMNEYDIGIKVAGGKGNASRKTLTEIEEKARNEHIAEKLKYASRITAKVDNAIVQDGYELYHHCILFDDKGRYSVVQQGLRKETGYARRYHWFSEGLSGGFVEEPHSGIAGIAENCTLDLTAKENREVRKASVDLINDNPKHLYRYFSVDRKQCTLGEFMYNGWEKRLDMKRGHYITGVDLSKSDKRVLEKAYELQPKNYEELVMIEGMGPKKIRALALVASLVYGCEVNWKDPVIYSFAHGGKDGVPFPVQKKVYDNTIKLLEDVMHNGGMEKEKVKENMRILEKLLFMDYC
ncbi:MAG: DUF763 domain-containing protein [Thermoplasmata archaeon]